MSGTSELDIKLFNAIKPMPEQAGKENSSFAEKVKARREERKKMSLDEQVFHTLADLEEMMSDPMEDQKWDTLPEDEQLRRLDKWQPIENGFAAQRRQMEKDQKFREKETQKQILEAAKRDAIYGSGSPEAAKYMNRKFGTGVVRGDVGIEQDFIRETDVLTNDGLQRRKEIVPRGNYKVFDDKGRFVNPEHKKMYQATFDRWSKHRDLADETKKRLQDGTMNMDYLLSLDPEKRHLTFDFMRDMQVDAGKMGLGEQLTDANYDELIPFIGTAVTLFKNGSMSHMMRKVIEHQKNGVAYEDRGLMSLGTDPETIPDEKIAEYKKEVEKFIVAAEYLDARGGKTIPAKVAEVVQEMIPYAVEFVATGGMAAGARAGTKQAAKALMKKYTENKLKRTVVKLGARTVGGIQMAAARTALNPTRLLAGVSERTMGEYGQDAEGNIIQTMEGEGIFTAASKTAVDQFIENLSETSGEAFSRGLRKVPGLNKVKTWLAKKGLSPKGVVAKLATKTGFNGVAEEMGEERFGALLRALTPGMDETMGDVIPGWEQWVVEAAAFSVPGMGYAAAGKAVDHVQRRKMANTVIKSHMAADVYYANNKEDVDEFLANVESKGGQPGRRDMSKLGLPGLNSEQRGQFVEIMKQRRDRDKYIKDIVDEQEAELKAQEAEDGTVPMEEPQQEERRSHLAFREAVENLTPEQLRQAVEDLRADRKSNRLTGLPNTVAWAEAEEEAPAPIKIQTDLEGLKYANDTLGKEMGIGDDAGDEVLKAAARAMQNAGLDAYHTHGDTFLFRAENEEQAQAMREKLTNTLNETIIEIAGRDGSIRTFKGLGLSFGRGNTLEDAHADMEADKKRREASGERAERGEKPRGMVEIPEEGRQDNEGDSPRRQGLREDTGPVREAEDEDGEEGTGGVAVKPDQPKPPQPPAQAKTSKDSENARTKLSDGKTVYVRDPENVSQTYKINVEESKIGGHVVKVKNPRGVVVTKGPGPHHQWSKDYALDKAMSEVESLQNQTAAEEPKTESKQQEQDAPDKTLAKNVKDFLVEHLPKGRNLDEKTFFELADKAYGGTRAEGKYGVSDAYDALETGINMYIAEWGEQPDVPLIQARTRLEKMEKLNDRIPTQRNRSGEKDTFQQFSTPPHYAYAVNWLANLKDGDVVLEPSAGTGNLLVHAAHAGGVKVYGNELSERRATLLKELGAAEVFTEDAEQIHNILPGKMPRPTAIVMNPPFSHAGHRMGEKTISGTDLNHIDAALELLADGGRLVAITGHHQDRVTGEDTKTFTRWKNKIGQKYALRGNVVVDGKVYKSMGTQYPTRVLVIDKVAPGAETVENKVDSVYDLMNTLSGVQDERKRIEPERSEPTVQESALGTETGPGSSVSIQSPTSSMGSEQSRSERPLDETTPEPSTTSRSDARVEPTERTSDTDVPERDRTRGDRSERTDRDDAPEPTVEPERKDGDVQSVSNIDVETKIRDRKTSEISESIFEAYEPAKVNIPKAKKHPASLVESAAMAATEPPDPGYQPKLPAEVIEKGILSEPQIENVIYAGQAHEKFLPTGSDGVEYRRGYMIGDGTGVGKGREIAGIILDNFNHGRKKAIWVSENQSLLGDANRDMKALGMGKLLLQNKYEAGTEIKANDGVLYSTYATLASAPKGKKTRLEQITDWLGKDFDGVIIFDEAHNMANALPQAGKRGKKNASQRALAGVELQKLLPNARVVYVSATAATEVSNLAYADRLGLWGKGTSFPNKKNFINEISTGGVATMELVARDMKAQGSYLARSISFNDGTEKGTVKYDRITHDLNQSQVVIYDKLAEAWQVVLQNIGKALEITAAKKTKGGDVKVDGTAKSRAMSAFWGAHQRFFNQLITAMQTPSIIKGIEKDLAEGRSAVIQLTNTYEAAQERALSKMGKEDDLDDFDITPRDMLLQLVEHSFPVAQMVPYMDENGNEKMQVATDSSGNPILNQQAVAMREQLLDELSSIRVPESPLDMILNHFGADNVAEITGRRRRVIQTDEGKKIDKRGKKAREADVQAFMAGKKRILLFSEAGGTGASYHAALDVENQEQRHHYLLQPGWRADKAIQGLGRTHRSNQAQAPIYTLVTTNLKAQKRFISTIARRLDQLGALTKGQRQTGSTGIFSAADNLESVEAREALYGFFRDLAYGGVGSISLGEFQDQTGLRLVDDKGSMLKSLPDITQFLNRLLSLEIELQNKVFEEFDSRMNERIEIAIQNGTLDQGMETYRADSIEKVDEQTVYTTETGSETKYVKFLTRHKVKPMSWVSAQKAEKFIKNVKTNKMFAVFKTGSTTVAYTGEVLDRYRLSMPTGNAQYIDAGKLQDRIENESFQEVEDGEAEKIWNQQIEDAPKFSEREVHLVTGAILPIWDRLRGKPRVFRLQTDEGEQHLGRVIPDKELKATLRALGASAKAPKLSPAEAVRQISDGAISVELSNGWRVKRSSVNGEWRIEVVGPDFQSTAELLSDGVFAEKINSTKRYFIPTGENGAKVLEAITKNRPIVDVQRKSGGAEKLLGMAAPFALLGVDFMTGGSTSGVSQAGMGLLGLGLVGSQAPQVAKALDNLGAAFEKGFRLRKSNQKAYEQLRRVFTSQDAIRDDVRDAIVEQFGNISKKDRELLQYNRENPEKFPLPDRLHEAAEVRDQLYDTIEKELLRREMIGKWPESAIQKNLDKINALESEMADLKTKAAKGKRADAIQELEAENELLSTLRYARRIVNHPEVAHQLESWSTKGNLKEKIRALPKRLIGRQFTTMEQLRDAGFEFETDVAVALADLLAYARHKITIYEYHETMKEEYPDLVRKKGYTADELRRLLEDNGHNLPESATKARLVEVLETREPAAWDEYQEKYPLAPREWLDVHGLDQYKGYAVHPIFREALYDFTETPSPTSKPGKFYDRLNAIWKQVKFYNFFVMTWNNLQQGFAAGGLRSPLNFKAAFKDVSEKSALYRACQAGDLFSMPEDLPVAEYLESVKKNLNAVTDQSPIFMKWMKKASGIETMDEFIKSLTPTDNNVLLKMSRNLTWWLDRVARVATVKALEAKGMRLEDAIVRARNFHADYNIVRKEPAKWMRRAFLTPAYQTAMWYRLFPELIGKPKENAGAIARIAGMYGFTWAVMALAGYAWVEGYRFVKPVPPDGDDDEEKESVILMIGPFSEPFKAVGRAVQGYESGGIFGAIERTLYNKLAAIPHLIVSLRRNRNWKGEEILKRGAPSDVNTKRFLKFLLTEIYPLADQVEDWNDKETEAIDNVLRIAAITRFERKPFREYYFGKLRTRLANLRKWAKEESDNNPDMKEHFYRRAGQEFAKYCDEVNSYFDHHDRKLQAMKDPSVLNRMLAQFELSIPERDGDQKNLAERELALRLYEATSKPVKQKRESQAHFDERMEKYNEKQYFLQEYLKDALKGMDEDAVDAMLKEEVKRRGERTIKYGKNRRMTSYGKRAKRLKEILRANQGQK